MKNSMEKLKKIPIQSMAIVLGLILMVTFFSIASSNFLTPSNINNILLATMINGILSVGALYVVVTGGIDVSIGTSMTFVSVMLGVFMNWWGIPAWMGIICGILTGAAVGLINGIMVTKMKITPFIATLGMQMVTAGLAIVITDGTPIYFTQIQGYQNIWLRVSNRGEKHPVGTRFCSAKSSVLYLLRPLTRERGCHRTGQTVSCGSRRTNICKHRRLALRFSSLCFRTDENASPSPSADVL